MTIIFYYLQIELHYIKHQFLYCRIDNYYNHFERDEVGKNPPLIVDYKKMEQFISLTTIMNEHIKIVDNMECNFKYGDFVRVTDGMFKGIEGRVARVSGQQRVIVELKGLCLVATAYMPTSFIERL